MEKRGPSCTLSGNVSCYSHYRETLSLKKIGIKLPYDPTVPLLGIYPAAAAAAAVAAKPLQSCLTLCDPIDDSPPGTPVPGILQARTLEWVAVSFSDA